MSFTDFTFYLLSLCAILFGWRVFRTDSMVRASFLLLLSFISVALIMLLLAAPYLSYATIFMMAVEMMVMALFMVVFMMNPAGLNPMSMVHQVRLARIAGVMLFALIGSVALWGNFPDAPVSSGRNVIQALGKELLGDSMLVFETAGITLLAAMIGSVILSSNSGRFGPTLENSRPPPLNTGGEPADFQKTREFLEKKRLEQKRQEQEKQEQERKAEHKHDSGETG